MKKRRRKPSTNNTPTSKPDPQRPRESAHCADVEEGSRNSSGGDCVGVQRRADEGKGGVLVGGNPWRKGKAKMENSHSDPRLFQQLKRTGRVPCSRIAAVSTTNASEGSSPRLPNIDSIPFDTHIHVLSFVSKDDLRSAACVCQKWRKMFRYPSPNHPLLWRLALQRLIQGTNYYRAIEESLNTNALDLDEKKHQPMHELKMGLGVKSIAGFFKMYTCAVLREACYYVVDWPTQFDGTMIHSEPQHPHYIATLDPKEGAAQKSKGAQEDGGRRLSGPDGDSSKHPSEEPICFFPHERMAYMGSLSRGDRALRSDRPFPRLGTCDDSADPFAMPICVSQSECEALRMFPDHFSCRQKHERVAAVSKKKKKTKKTTTTTTTMTAAAATTTLRPREARRRVPSSSSSSTSSSSRQGLSVRARITRALRCGSSPSPHSSPAPFPRKWERKGLPSSSVSSSPSPSPSSSSSQRMGRPLSGLSNTARSPRERMISCRAADIQPGIQLVFSVIAYFEVEIEESHPGGLADDGGCLAIGLARRPFPLVGRQPGWDSFSFGYHGDDGCIFHSSGVGHMYGSSFGPGDTVGCGLNYLNNTVFFTKNGAFLGTAFHQVPPGSYFPVVGVDTRHPFRINFGLAKPFAFELLIYHQQQMERAGLLTSQTYPRHPLLPLLEKRVRRRAPRRTSPSPERKQEAGLRSRQRYRQRLRSHLIRRYAFLRRAANSVGEQDSEVESAAQGSVSDDNEDIDDQPIEYGPDDIRNMRILFLSMLEDQ